MLDMNITEIIISETFKNSQKNVCNVKRKDVTYWATELNPETDIWISIGEPELPESVINNPVLNKIPSLHIQFWDVEINTFGVFNEKYPVASDEEIKTIFEFISKHKDKNILVNCAAGISRSGAIAAFCSDILGYNWIGVGLERAVPNKYIYNKLIKYYEN